MDHTTPPPLFFYVVILWVWLHCTPVQYIPHVHWVFIFIGIKFWKVGSRKIFAVSSFAEPPCKKRCYEDDLSDKIDIIDHKISKILAVTPHMRIPPGLSIQLFDAFRCNICQCSPLHTLQQSLEGVANVS